MDNVYVLHNIKGRSNQYKTLVISRYERFFLTTKSVNQLIQPLNNSHNFNIKTYIKIIANYNNIYQHIPYVNKRISLLPLKVANRNDQNTTWIGGHNIANIFQGKEHNSAIITFKDEHLPNIKVPVSSYYLEKRKHDAKIIQDGMHQNILLHTDIYEGINCIYNNYQTQTREECLPTYLRRKHIEEAFKWAKIKYTNKMIIEADNEINKNL